MSDKPFDAKAARAKRPLPLWIDAIVTDTQHLEPDEYGVYVRILGAMWRREACALDYDERRLAIIGGVSPRLWRSRVGPAVMALLTVRAGIVSQKRLQQEAATIERFLIQQSNRRAAEKTPLPESDPYAEPEVQQLDHGENVENHDNPLKPNEPDQSADRTADQSPERPTYYLLPTGREEGGGVSSARESPALRERILDAMGIDRSGISGPNGRILGTQSDMTEVERWRSDLGLSEPDILGVVAETMAARCARGEAEPPATFRYFRLPMQRLASARASPPLEPAAQPSPTPKGARNAASPSNAQFAAAHREYLRRVAAGEIDPGPDPSDPFA